jgi:hypothetical protein
MSARKATRRPRALTIAAQRRQAVERAFPGVICKRVAFECAYRPADSDSFRDWADGKKYSLNLTVEASAETLVSHGLVEQEEIDRLPPSGRRCGLEKTNRGTYQASIYYFEHFDTPMVAREMAAKIGISDPRHMVYSSSGWRRAEVEPGKIEVKSNVIPFPKKNPRAVSPVDSYLVDATAMPGFIAIYIPSDVRANLIGSALACIGLQPTTESGRLVARWAESAQS